MIGATAYRVLSSRVKPAPILVYLSPDDTLVAEPYMDLAQLPPPIQVIVVRLLWERHSFDPRETPEDSIVYVRVNELSALTDGAVSAQMVEPPREPKSVN